MSFFVSRRPESSWNAIGAVEGWIFSARFSAPKAGNTAQGQTIGVVRCHDGSIGFQCVGDGVDTGGGGEVPGAFIIMSASTMAILGSSS